MKEDVTGDWRRLRDGQCHNLSSSADINSVIKSRLMRWAGSVVRMGERSRDISVGKLAGFWRDDRGSVPGTDRNYFFAPTVVTGCGIYTASFPGLKLPERDADHLLPTNIEIKNA
jgi:hypothetical protein